VIFGVRLVCVRSGLIFIIEQGREGEAIGELRFKTLQALCSWVAARVPKTTLFATAYSAFVFY
jgi:hypothetical protein